MQLGRTPGTTPGAVPQFPSITPRRFCSCPLPPPASRSPPAAARSFLCHQHSSSRPKQGLNLGHVPSR